MLKNEISNVLGQITTKDKDMSPVNTEKVIQLREVKEHRAQSENKNTDGDWYLFKDAPNSGRSRAFYSQKKVAMIGQGSENKPPKAVYKTASNGLEISVERKKTSFGEIRRKLTDMKLESEVN